MNIFDKCIVTFKAGEQDKENFLAGMIQTSFIPIPARIVEGLVIVLFAPSQKRKWDNYFNKEGGDRK